MMQISIPKTLPTFRLLLLSLAVGHTYGEISVRCRVILSVAQKCDMLLVAFCIDLVQPVGMCCSLLCAEDRPDADLPTATYIKSTEHKLHNMLMFGPTSCGLQLMSSLHFSNKWLAGPEEVLSTPLNLAFAADLQCCKGFIFRNATCRNAQLPLLVASHLHSYPMLLPPLNKFSSAAWCSAIRLHISMISLLGSKECLARVEGQERACNCCDS